MIGFAMSCDNYRIDEHLKHNVSNLIKQDLNSSKKSRRIK